MTRQGGDDTIADPGTPTPALAATVATDEALPAVAVPVRGDTIGRFVVLDVLGEGGVGVVYAAYDPNLDRKVAIKLLQGRVMSSAEARVRLLREAQAMARIDHPNVLRVHEAGTRGDQVYIAMEFAGGGTLKSWLARGRSRREIVGAFVQAGRGLAAAHAAGLVHRDFKPDNVLMFEDGSVRVTDFGLVGLAGEQGAAVTVGIEKPIDDMTPLSQDLTRTGAVMGTPAYMAPEQFHGGAVGPAADQFAFCVALYEALYRARPFAGSTFGELATNVAAGQLAPAPRDADVAPWLRRAIVRGLAVDPARRHPSMTALLAQLGREPVRRRRTYAIAGAAVLAVGAAAAVTLWPGDDASVCGGGGARLAIAWNPAQRAKVAGAFAATHRPDARDVFDRVAPIIDRWGTTWQQAYVGACEDTRVREVQSEHVLDLRMACLTRRLDEARATIELLAAGGGDAVDHALESTLALPSVAPCADTTALESGIAPPATPEAQQVVAAVRGKLDQAHAQDKLGRYRDGLSLARGALAAARATGYGPVIAEAELEVGSIQLDLSDRAASATLGDAMATALGAGDSTTAIRAAARRVVAIVSDTAQFALAGELGKIGDALATRARPAADVAVELDDAVGLVEAKSQHPKAARARYEQALALARSQLGDEHPLTAKTESRLAGLDVQEGKFEDARKRLEGVVAAEERIAGPDHPAVALALDDLSHVYVVQSKLAEARRIAERALAIRTRALGADHPDVGGSYNTLGGIAATAGDPQTAMGYYQKSLAVLEHVYGPDDIHITAPLVNLGDALADVGDTATARKDLERALAIEQHAYGADDPRVAEVLSDLGQVSKADRRFDDAISQFQRAEDITEKVYGPDHADVARYVGNLASVYMVMGKLPEARELTARTVSLMARIYGPDHPKAAAALANFGFLQMQLHEPAGALDSFGKAEKIFLQRLGDHHPAVAACRIGKAEALIELHREAEAVPLLEQALAIGTAAHMPPIQLAETHFHLARALIANPKQRARARSEIKLAITGYHDVHDAKDEALARHWLASH